MSASSLPSSVSVFLGAHGWKPADGEGPGNPAGLVRVFRASAPSDPVSSLSPEDHAWASAVLDCLRVMDERLYEHYRAMIDLLRAYFFRADREDLLSLSAWDDVRIGAVRLGILPEDLFGQARPRPHLAVPEILPRVLGGRL